MTTQAYSNDQQVKYINAQLQHRIELTPYKVPLTRFRNLRRTIWWRNILLIKGLIQSYICTTFTQDFLTMIYSLLMRNSFRWLHACPNSIPHYNSFDPCRIKRDFHLNLSFWAISIHHFSNLHSWKAAVWKNYFYLATSIGHSHHCWWNSWMPQSLSGKELLLAQVVAVGTHPAFAFFVAIQVEESFRNFLYESNFSTKTMQEVSNRLYRCSWIQDSNFQIIF